MRKLVLLLALLGLARLTPAQTVPQSNWRLVFADSANAGYPATNAFDGNPGTFWHTDWQTTNSPLPHEIQIDLGAVYSLTSFSYQPRQDWQINGDVTQYNFYVSTDLTQSWNLVSSGTMAPCGGGTTTKTFPATLARFIRLQATASCNGNWMNVAELNVTGTLAAPVSPNVPLAINSGSAAVYNDGTAILSGPVVVSQYQNSSTVAQIGTINSDSFGNLTGSLTVNPNWQDSNGNLTFLFGLPVAPNIFTYSVPVGQFQHNSTGLTISLVLFKQGALAIKSQTLAVTP